VETYKYKAVDAAGQRVSGMIDAAHETDLELRLGRMGLDLIGHRRLRRGGAVTRSRRTSRAEIIHFTFHLEQLLRAGVPLIDALRDLGPTVHDPRLRDIVAELVEAIEGGRTFSEALAAFPGVFGHVYIAMVRVGEQSGRLPTVLHDLNEMLRWQDEIIAHAKRVMVYPLIVLTVVGAVIAFLMVYLVPKLTRFLNTMDMAVPAHTQALIATSGLLVDWWWLLAAVAVAAPIAVRYGSRHSPRFRYRWDALKLRVWLFGDLAYKIRLARFANYFAMMCSAGISVLEALRMAESLVDNAVLEHGIARARGQIGEGRTLSEAFAQTALFPPLVVRMMRVGETTGALDEALHNVSYFYTRAVRGAVERIQPMLQPVLTLVLAALVGWIMLSVIGPVYDTIASLEL
jgi:type IV pilus assembly protein PilC